MATRLGLQQPGSLSLAQQTATTTTAVKPISTTTASAVLGGAGLPGLGQQSSQPSSISGLKLPNLASTVSTTPAVASGTGLGLGGLGGLKQTTTTTGTSAATAGPGLGGLGLLNQHLSATMSTAATALPTTASKAQTTLKTEFKGLGGVGTAETTKKGAGRDGLVHADRNFDERSAIPIPHSRNLKIL